MEKVREAVDFEPHPNLIFGVLVDTGVTEGGVIKPDSVKDRTPTIRIIALGKTVAEQFEGRLSVGSECYMAAPYMQYAEINGVDMVVCYADAVMGIKKPKLQTIGEA